jgi:protein phosphatase
MRLQIAARTDVGKKRKHNEDSLLSQPELGLFGVADGMGGHAAGEVASNEALQALYDTVLANRATLDAYDQDPSSVERADDVRRMLEFAVRNATYQVFGLSEVDPDRRGMGTTLTLLLLRSGVAFIAHVGDSRLYVLRKGVVKVATTDHTFVNALVQQGRLTPEQAARSKYSNVLLRAVGSKDYVEVETRMVRHQAQDLFVLCTDGLHGYLKKGELASLVDPADLETSAARLIDLANARGGKDNITVVLIRVDE